MIDRIKIARLPDGRLAYATFDTRAQDEGKDYGCRVKHYIYRDEEHGAYWHERVYLSHIAEPGWSHFDRILVSERKFWGKVRLVRYRDASLPETWKAVAECIKVMEGEL